MSKKLVDRTYQSRVSEKNSPFPVIAEGKNTPSHEKKIEEKERIIWDWIFGLKKNPNNLCSNFTDMFQFLIPLRISVVINFGNLKEYQ